MSCCSNEIVATQNQRMVGLWWFGYDNLFLSAKRIDAWEYSFDYFSESCVFQNYIFSQSGFATWLIVWNRVNRVNRVLETYYFSRFLVVSWAKTWCLTNANHRQTSVELIKWLSDELPFGWSRLQQRNDLPKRRNWTGLQNLCTCVVQRAYAPTRASIDHLNSRNATCI